MSQKHFKWAWSRGSNDGYDWKLFTLTAKGNFPGKPKNNRSIWICLTYNLSTSLLSTLITYVKNMSNWPDPGGQMMDMTQNYSLWPHKGNFLGKNKNNRSIWICLKYNLCTSLLSTFMTCLKNILNGPDPGGQMMDMTQNYSLLRHKGSFPLISKNNKSTQICYMVLGVLEHQF